MHESYKCKRKQMIVIIIRIVPHENLFFNCSSTQKPINVYSLLLPIPPNSCSSLYMGETKQINKKKRLHILWVLLNWDMYRLTKAITCLSLAGFQSGSNKTSRFPPIKLRPQPPALLLKRNANSSYKMLQLQLFIIISSDHKRNTKIN